MTKIYAPAGMTGLAVEPWTKGEIYAVAADWAQASSPVLVYGKSPEGWDTCGLQVANFRHNDRDALEMIIRQAIEMGGDEPDADEVSGILDDAEAIEDSPTVARLATMLADEDSDEDAIREAASHLSGAGSTAEIETDDDSPDDLGNDTGSLWVVSTHRLLIDGELAAEWTRYSVGHYGAQGQRHLADSWEVDEDTDGGDSLPDAVAIVLDAFGLEDEFPGVPEPEGADEVEDGQWAVLNKNDYAVSTPPDSWEVVSRHASEEEARKACDACWRGFLAHTTQGTYGPEWCVGEMVDGEWQPTEDDDDR